MAKTMATKNDGKTMAKRWQNDGKTMAAENLLRNPQNQSKQNDGKTMAKTMAKNMATFVAIVPN